MSNDMSNWMVEHQRELSSSRDKGRSYLLGLIPLCKAAQIDRVVAHYDGSGDSGAFEQDGVTAFSGDEEKELATLAIKSDELLDACYNVLEYTHPGWEINEGSYGDVVLYVNESIVKIEHDARVTSTEHSETEV
jgi:hypothetical protein